MKDFTNMHCKPLAKGESPLDPDSVRDNLKSLEGWQVIETMNAIYREYRFRDYYHTMAFINAAAWIAHTEDHHPDMHVGYNRCTITYSTHSVGGLSENDFICAARTNALFHDHSQDRPARP
jgi:4a-hydroxytetrahydrobiopterin dehydratase